jgi:ubiquitin fusion degradation protein 1
MLFRLENTEKAGTQTHCGVLEFTAEEGTCFIPFWMMQNLLIEEGALITVVNVSLPKATFVKLQPQHVDFLEITNPRAVLEHALRNFSCVTKGDIIQLPYNDKNYHFELKEVKPADAACIIETDCEVDFDAPVGYQEPTKEEMLARSRAGSEAGSMTSGGTGGGSSVFANMPKQSAYAPAEARSSACPSPAPSSMSGASGLAGNGGGDDGGDAAAAAQQPQGVRLVDGKIVRPEEDGMLTSSAAATNVDPSQVAERTGSTGVQRNAAIPDRAPQLDYWAVNAGDGARLDGKKPAPLKDREGNEVDVRKLRAEAAARRAAAAAKAAAESSSLPPMEGSDEAAAATAKPPAVPVSKRKSRVAGKYSRLNKSNAAFQGSANKFG